MLLAAERGLETCPQVSWTLWPNAVRSALDIADDEKVMLGLALGYGERDNPVNQNSILAQSSQIFASL